MIKIHSKKEITEKAPWYTYNPYTPHYFKNPEKWHSYLETCTELNKKAVKAKCMWLHRRIGHYWRLHRTEKHTLDYYNKHYGIEARLEDKKSKMLMPNRLMSEYGSIILRMENSWDNPPPAMASLRYWETFLYNCMDITILDKIDIVITNLLNHLNLNSKSF